MADVTNTASDENQPSDSLNSAELTPAPISNAGPISVPVAPVNNADQAPPTCDQQNGSTVPKVKEGSALRIIVPMLILVVGYNLCATLGPRIYAVVAPFLAELQKRELHQNNVTVTQESATLGEKYWDNRDWEQKKGHPAAYTYWSYICRPDFRITPQPEQTQGNHYTFRVDSVAVALSLPIHTWLPYGAPDWLKTHEYGHTTICKRIYSKSPQIAYDCAQELIGTTVSAQADTQEHAAKLCKEDLQRTLDSNYRSRCSDIATGISDTYDQITDHGKNQVKTDDGIEMAFKEYLAEHPNPYLR